MKNLSRIAYRHPFIFSGFLLSGASSSSLVGLSLIESAFQDTSSLATLSSPGERGLDAPSDLFVELPAVADLRNEAPATLAPTPESAPPPDRLAVNDAVNDLVDVKASLAPPPSFSWPSPITAFQPPAVVLGRHIPELPSVDEIKRLRVASFGSRQMRLAARRPPLFTSVPPKIAPAYLPDDLTQQASSEDMPPSSDTLPVPPRRPDGLRRLARVRFAPQTQTLPAAAASAPQPVENRNFLDALFGPPPAAAAASAGSRAALAYAPADGWLFSGNSGQAAISASTRASGQTAVYDISARMVYLPDGTRLEAHSGLGSLLDDPRYAHVRMRGVTPPHVYALTPREALFHGVEALRLNPVGGSGAIHGRAGLLAHTYMLGANGDSNGCVSIRDYGTFLRAYKGGQIRYLSVVSGGR